MAVITQTSATSQSVAVDIARTSLSASDTLTYVRGSKQMLLLYNPSTTAAVTVTIKGSEATTIALSGYGGDIDVSAGKAITVPISGSTLIDLDDIWAFLKGTVTVEGGTGLVAHLFV